MPKKVKSVKRVKRVRTVHTKKYAPGQAQCVIREMSKVKPGNYASAKKKLAEADRKCKCAPTKSSSTKRKGRVAKASPKCKPWPAVKRKKK